MTAARLGIVHRMPPDFGMHSALQSNYCRLRQHCDCKCHLLYRIWATDSPTSTECRAIADQPRKIVDSAATIVRMLMIRSLPFKIKSVVIEHFKPTHNHIITNDTSPHSGNFAESYSHFSCPFLFLNSGELKLKLNVIYY